MNELTPVMQQYMEIKKKHKDKLLLFRMGDFYEFFYDDAKEASEILDIVLTCRGSANGDKIPMAGFPVHSANSFIIKLINSGKILAICEQVGISKGKNKLIERKVVKVLTPGTIIDDDYLFEDYNNYICCISNFDECYAFAVLDISSGYFCVSNIRDESILLSEIERISPSEILVSGKFSRFDLFTNFKTIHRWDSNKFCYKFAYNILFSHLGLKKIKGFVHDKNLVIVAGCLLDYVAYTQRCKLENIVGVDIVDVKSLLYIDAVSKVNLEIMKNSRGGVENTLRKSIDNTLTSMGKRLLKFWLNAPLLSRKDLNDRLVSVSILKEKQSYLLFENSLKKISDLDRILTRVIFKTAKPIDLNKLSLSLKEVSVFVRCMKLFKLQGVLKFIFKKLKNHIFLIELIDNAIAADVMSGSLSEFIKSGYDELLDKYRDVLDNLKKTVFNFEFSERKRVNIPILKIKIGSSGLYFEVTKLYFSRVPGDYRKILSLKNCERYVTDDLLNLSSDIRNCEKNIFDRERELYFCILDKIKENIISLYDFSKGIAVLDVIQGFAKKSFFSNYVKPDLVDDDIVDIRNGRHIVVEESLSKHFVTNDLYLDNLNKVLIITGANMGGKSTFMKQCAQIIFLAHIGSHVPASYAKIGYIDKILTRIGSSDDISRSSSTFMLEMRETASILSHATKNSFVLIDEIGRGTSVSCAIPLAWSIIRELHIKNNAFVLFSTHFFELVKISNEFHKIKNICFPLIKVNNDLIFTYKAKNGSTTDSYGIEVASLAGISSSVVCFALRKQIELDLNKKTLKKMKFFDDVLNILKSISPDDISPKKALSIIYNLKKIYDDRTEKKK